MIATTVVEPISAGKVPDWILNKARDADTEAMSQSWAREHESDKRQARDQLAEFMGKQQAPFTKAEVVVCEGNAAEQILSLVEKRHVDLDRDRHARHGPDPTTLHRQHERQSAEPSKVLGAAGPRLTDVQRSSFGHLRRSHWTRLRTFNRLNVLILRA